MSSPNGKMVIDRSPGHRSSRNNSVETHRTIRSRRSRSRSRDRHGSRRDRPDDEKRKRSSRSRERRAERDRERSRREKDRTKDRERRSRSRDRSHRDRDRGREPRDRERRPERDDDPRKHDRDREHRRGESRYSDRAERDRGKDRDLIVDDTERRERRRKRPDEMDELDRDYEERNKRKREERLDGGPHPPPSSAGLPPPPPPPRDDSRRTRSRDSERRRGRTPRDPRDEFDDAMRLPVRRDREFDNRLDLPSPPPPAHVDDEDLLSPVRSSPPPMKRPSPSYEPPIVDPMDDAKEDDSEARSVFVSQLAARMTARDLGYFFEDKLGEGSVMDSRIVTDRLSRRSKGIAYVEFRAVDLVEKAISLSGTIVMGLPIMIQHTESERNKTHAGDGSLHLPPGVSGHHGAMQLYVGSLHFNLTESDIKQVFEPFGELEFVDLHRDPMTGRSKGYAFVQYKRPEDAKMALEQMEGFELAGRTLRVNTVHEKGTVRYTQQDSLEENGGGNLNAASRQALMQKLARTDQPQPKVQPIMKPNIPQAMTSKSVLLRNMFDPEEETERDWDKDLADDVKGECEGKYGKVIHIKVEKESEGEIYLQFDSVDSAKQAIDGLNGRWFGGKQISATFISDAIMQAHR